MSILQRKYLRIILATIYITYCGVASFCIHTHVVNGVAYVHSHPNKSEDHRGNLSEIILFSNQSSSVENITITELKIASYLKFIEEINLCQKQLIIQQKYTGNYFLRPPPFVFLF